MRRIRRFLALWWPVGLALLAIVIVVYADPHQMQAPFLMLCVLFALYAMFVRYRIIRRDREIGRLRQQLGSKDMDNTRLRDEIRRQEFIVLELRSELARTLRQDDDNAD